MAMDFTVVFAGPDCELGLVLTRVEELGHLAGHVRSSALTRVEYDRSRGVFDEVEEELAGFEHIADISEGLARWEGAAVELSSPDAGALYVLVGRSPLRRHLNVWVDVSRGLLERLAADGALQPYYAGLNAIGRAVDAGPGYGDLELPFEAIDPDALRGRVELSQDPERRRPTQLLIVPLAELGPAGAERSWPGCRSYQFVHGYSFIETPEFQACWLS